MSVLEAGGNATDAGVCAGICIGVLQTEKVNFGGVAPTIIFRAEDRIGSIEPGKQDVEIYI